MTPEQEFEVETPSRYYRIWQGKKLYIVQARSRFGDTWTSQSYHRYLWAARFNLWRRRDYEGWERAALRRELESPREEKALDL